MTKLFDIKIDNRTRPERQAAKMLGVSLKHAITEVRTVYGKEHSYSQAWRAECGKVIVIAANDRFFNASLAESSFDWDEDLSSDQRNYAALNRAGGLTEAKWRP